MIKKRNKFQLGLMLVALPFVATAAASAHQWISSATPIAAPEAVTAVNASADRLHNITLNSNGGIEGRITSLKNSEGEGLADLKVYFVRNGKIAKEAVTDASGTFRIDNVADGAYSFVATGQNGFAAYGVNVVANNGSSKVNAMEAAAVSPRFAVVKEILENNLPQQIAAEILDGASNITDQLVGANRIKLQNGSLVGNIVPLFGEISAVEGTQVHIIQNDKQVARVQTDVNGDFSVADLEPGVYDFVAAGPTGIAAVSFQAIDEEGEIAAESVIDSDEIPVAIEPAAAAAALPFQDVVSADIPMEAASSLNVCTTCSNDAGFVGQQVSYAGQEVVYDGGYDAGAPIQYASEAVSCGGACGASCGSAGDFSGFSSCNSCGGAGGGRLFGGGSTGLRRLALLGGIAGAVIAIASDDDASPNSPN
ncbi:carboxypeptidase-like regulatory domain-containing protein [Mariniblastus fucicola]|nr:carboxypeptidase-like regulatory domain-containing protein [Mariniblastus fucicola]